MNYPGYQNYNQNYNASMFNGMNNNMNYNSYNDNLKQEIIRVNGENGARAYQMAPNSSVLLLDEQSPIVWLKSTDGAGYASITPYSITPYQSEPPIDVKSLENRIKKLEEKINESNTTSTKHSEAKSHE